MNIYVQGFCFVYMIIFNICHFNNSMKPLFLLSVIYRQVQCSYINTGRFILYIPYLQFCSDWLFQFTYRQVHFVNSLNIQSHSDWLFLYTYRQVQGIVYMLLMQFIAQPLSSYELHLGTGCSTTNQKANDFTPQDWTSKTQLDELLYQQSVCWTICNGIWFNKMQDITLCTTYINPTRRLNQHTSHVWRNILSRTRHHFKRCFWYFNCYTAHLLKYSILCYVWTDL